MDYLEKNARYLYSLILAFDNFMKVAMLGFHNRSCMDLPSWSALLQNYYYMIRVEGRDKAKRIRYYRKLQKEKLRLAELGIDQTQINAVCKYCVSLKQINADRLSQSLNDPIRQLSFNFDAQ